MKIMVKGDSRGAHNRIKFKHKDLFETLMNYQNIVPYATKFTELAYCYIYKLTKRPLCIECNKAAVKKFHGFNQGYSWFCSTKCMSVNRAVLSVKEKTNFKKYNCRHPSQSNIVKQRLKHTLRKRYKVENINELRWKK